MANGQHGQRGEDLQKRTRQLLNTVSPLPASSQAPKFSPQPRFDFRQKERELIDWEKSLQIATSDLEKIERALNQKAEALNQRKTKLNEEVEAKVEEFKPKKEELEAKSKELDLRDKELRAKSKELKAKIKGLDEVTEKQAKLDEVLKVREGATSSIVALAQVLKRIIDELGLRPELENRDLWNDFQRDLEEVIK